MIAVIHNYPDNENEPSSLQTRSSYGEIIVEETNHWKQKRLPWPPRSTCALLVFLLYEAVEEVEFISHT